MIEVDNWTGKRVQLSRVLNDAPVDIPDEGGEETEAARTKPRLFEPGRNSDESFDITYNQIYNCIVSGTGHGTWNMEHGGGQKNTRRANMTGTLADAYRDIRT